jgi:ubiquinone/menaquinone biosynthesis C-methylase UbiE
MITKSEKPSDDVGPLFNRMDEVHTYFSKQGTVSQWWYPENGVLKNYYAHQQRIFDSLVKAESLDANILDVCTGRGRFAIRLSQLGFRNITAIDLSEEMLGIAEANARARNANIKFYQDSAETLEKIPDGSMDLICLMEAFDHIPDTGKALKAIFRKLKPEGKLIGTFVNSNSLYGTFFALYQNFIGRSSMIAQTFSPNKFGAALKNSGFKFKDFIGVEFFIFPHDRIPLLRTLLFPSRVLGRLEARLYPKGHSNSLTARFCPSIIFLAKKLSK